MLHVFENIGRGLVNRGVPRAGDGLRPGAGVDGKGFQAVLNRRARGFLGPGGLCRGFSAGALFRFVVHALNFGRFDEMIPVLTPLQPNSP